ncbi:AAA family ATPase [Candidatus Woesearchaeota archaeon]|nr:AAA family ATPase [Candidatus Woesearchaeota archaeon]
MKLICVTGVPGTGKTTLSKKLAKKLNFYYIDVNKVISKYNLSEGYDRKRKTRIIDVKKLNKVLIKEIQKIRSNNPAFFEKRNGKDKLMEMPLLSKARSTKTLNLLKSLKKYPLNKKSNKKIKKIEGIIIDSHLSHYLPRKYVDFCIVAKCNIQELNRRLKKKKFHQNKIKENLQAEIFDICYNEAIERNHKVIVFDTTKGFNISVLINKLDGYVS